MKNLSLKKITGTILGLLLIGVLSFSMFATVVPASAAIAYSEYEINTYNPKYDKTNYSKSIKFSGNKIIIKGKFEVSPDDSIPAIKKKKISIPISSTCEC
nr:hypothetical protein [Lachnospiraceae bacterium]